jgi:hypothetical protein
VAQVARGRRIDPDIDYHLDYQFRAWASIPEYAEWWPTLDVVDKEVFHLEWTGITESRLKELAQWAEQGALTSAQSVRYQELIELVEKNRPTLERLLAE